jgi:hypothetical protein
MPHDRWLRRQAIQLASQLPDGRDDALAILRFAKELVTGFLERDQQPVGSGLRLVEKLHLPCQLDAEPAH